MCWGGLAVNDEEELHFAAFSEQAIHTVASGDSAKHINSCPPPSKPSKIGGGAFAFGAFVSYVDRRRVAVSELALSSKPRSLRGQAQFNRPRLKPNVAENIGDRAFGARNRPASVGRAGPRAADPALAAKLRAVFMEPLQTVTAFSDETRR